MSPTAQNERVTLKNVLSFFSAKAIVFQCFITIFLPLSGS